MAKSGDAKKGATPKVGLILDSGAGSIALIAALNGQTIKDDRVIKPVQRDPSIKGEHGKAWRIDHERLLQREHSSVFVWRGRVGPLVWGIAARRPRFGHVLDRADTAFSTPLALSRNFGTWGPEVQILSLRPAFPGFSRFCAVSRLCPCGASVWDAISFSAGRSAAR